MICGPTGAGKTAAALWLAERYPIAIVSADSRQQYRHFDIGTAKPSAEELARVPHWGVNVLEPTERASAAQWADGAAVAIERARLEGRSPVVVGGTGMYLRALFGDFFEEPPLDPARRAELATTLATATTDDLRQRVGAVDPARAHLGRTQLLRALEIFELTGRPLSEWHRDGHRPPRFRARYLRVDPGPRLRDDLATRLDAMLAAGWMDEVAGLRQSVDADAPAWNATGYRAIREVVDGTTALAAARERVIVDTRHYAKRQRTWFRHQLPAGDVTAAGAQDHGWTGRIDEWWTMTAR